MSDFYEPECSEWVKISLRRTFVQLDSMFSKKTTNFSFGETIKYLIAI
jgi:hypothetical protein